METVKQELIDTETEIKGIVIFSRIELDKSNWIQSIFTLTL